MGDKAAGPQQAEAAGAPSAVGSDVAAIEASTASTVKAAQWLLGTAGALVPIIVAGVQLTRLGDAIESPGQLAAAIAALVLATIAICVVLALATAVLKVPYADLSEVLRIRSKHFKGGTWTDEGARARWDHAAQITSAGSGGRLEGVPQLHAEIQRLRSSSSETDDKLFTAAAVARLVVAHLNRTEIEKRFVRLRNAYITAAILVVACVTSFVVATSVAPGGATVDAPTAVRLALTGGEWPEGVGECEAGELSGVAVGGPWRAPDVVVTASEGCRPALVRAGDGIVAIPMVEDLAGEPQDAPALEVDEPTGVVVYRPRGSSWPSEALANCGRRRLPAVAVGGTWTAPAVVTRPRKGCPVTSFEGPGSVVVVPAEDLGPRRERKRKRS